MPKAKKALGGLIISLLLGQVQVFSQYKISVPFDVQPGERHSVVIECTRPRTDNLDYALERSPDEKMWAIIANISSQLSPHYAYHDWHPAEGLNYYRIVQKRHEERIAVSETKCIQIRNAGRLYIWPSPANDILHVRSPFINGYMDIIDSQGRFIRKVTIIDSITDVSLQALPTGMYFIHLRHGTEILVDKFIKQQSL